MTMFTISIVAVGSIKDTYLDLGMSSYRKRIQRFADLSIVEIRETPVPEDANQAIIQHALANDAKHILKAIPPSSYPILFDRKGSAMDSERFADNLRKLQLKTSHLTLLIGGSHGVHSTIQTMAKEIWSFSPLTFPHQLFRLMVFEQLYRGMTILHNHPYHK